VYQAENWQEAMTRDPCRSQKVKGARIRSQGHNNR